MNVALSSSMATTNPKTPSDQVKPEERPEPRSPRQPLPRRPTPIDHQIGSRHVGGSIGSEEQQGGIHLVRLCHTPQQGPSGIASDELGVMTLKHASGGEGIDTNPLAGVVGRKISGESEDSSLRHGVVDRLESGGPPPAPIAPLGST